MDTLTVTPNLILKPLEECHAPALFSLVDTNRAYLSHYLPWVAQALTQENSLIFIRSCRLEAANATAVHFGIFYYDELVGHVSLSHIQAGHQAEIGYWLAEAASHQGLMTQAVSRLINYAFDDLGLIRLLIRCRPDNYPSAAVAKRLGFQYEGTEIRGEQHHGVFHDLDRYCLIAPDA